MVIQGKNIEIGGGIVYLISTALKVIHFQQQRIRKGAWLEMPEDEYKDLSEDNLTKNTTNTT